MKALTGLLLALLILGIAIPVDGVSIMLIWNWFMPHVATGIPALTFSGGVGLTFVTLAVIPRLPRKDEEDENISEDLSRFVDSVLLKGVLVLIAWGVQAML